MYKFYKLLGSGTWKYCDTFNSTLDPEYHAYINWCNDNNMEWKLERASDGKILFQSQTKQQ